MMKHYEEVFYESFMSNGEFYNWIDSLNNDERHVVGYRVYETLRPKKIVVTFADLTAEKEEHE